MSTLGEFLRSLSLRRFMRDAARIAEAEMRRTPGLVAVIDQHAAAVRDMLATDVRGLHHSALLDYLRGFLDGAAERGWTPARAEPHEWETVRLYAVCWLAGAR